MIELFATLIGSVTGTVGSVIKNREEAKSRRNELDHDHRMAVLSKEELVLEHQHELAIADKEIDRAEVEGAYAVEQVDAKAFGDALLSESNKDSGALRIVKSAVRIVLTLYYTLATAFITYYSFVLIDGKVSVDFAEDIFRLCVSSVLYMALHFGTFWFNTRPSSHITHKYFK